MNSPFAANPTDHFDQKTWNKLTKAVHTLATKLCVYARDSGIGVGTDSRWPMIRLKKRRFLKVTVVTFGLQSNYLQDKNAFWEVYFQTVWNFWVFTKHISGGLASQFTNDQITEDEEMVLRQIQQTVVAKLLHR